MMFNSPRSGISTAPGIANMQGYMQQYVEPWYKIQQALAGNANLDAILLALSASGMVPGVTDTVGDDVASAAPADSDRAARREARRAARGGRDTGFVGGGYSQPGRVNANTGSWGNVLGALNGNQVDREVMRATKKALRGVDVGDDGVYVKEPKDRTRERSRTRTSKDGTTTTTTNVKVSRNGGKAIAVDSGSDGNRRKRKSY